MKLIGFLLVLFVGMSGLTFGQNIERVATDFWDAVSVQNNQIIIQKGEILGPHWTEKFTYRFDCYRNIGLYGECI